MRRENAKSSDAPGDTEGAGEEGFFRRWARRKQRARGEPADDPPDADSVEAAGPAAEKAPAEPERVLTDEDMPPLESLSEDSDYSGFMSPGVSDALRNLALRKMFLSSKYNFTDGLDDYAEDFTKFAPLGDVITSDMRHQMEMQAERAKKKLEEEARAAMDEAPATEGAAQSAAEDEVDPSEGREEVPAVAREDSRSGESDPGASTDEETRSG